MTPRIFLLVLGYFSVFDACSSNQYIKYQSVDFLNRRVGDFQDVLIRRCQFRKQMRLKGGDAQIAGIGELGPDSNIVPAVSEKLGRNLHNQQDHPLQIIKTWIQSHFDEVHKDSEGKPLFTSFDNLNPVVTTKQCFDDLLTPPDHVSRSRNDTYYLDDTRLLRSHMTAHQTTLLREGHRRFLYSGDVYRRDTVDACHYFAFHQMDGVRVFSWEELGVNNHQEAVATVLADLKDTLKGMVQAIFGDVQMKWVESYFPFTDPSLEVNRPQFRAILRYCPDAIPKKFYRAWACARCPCRA